mgnify:CR=1 FL=1
MHHSTMRTSTIRRATTLSTVLGASDERLPQSPPNSPNSHPEGLRLLRSAHRPRTVTGVAVPRTPTGPYQLLAWS